MSEHEVLGRLGDCGVVPVIVLDETAAAGPLADVLVAGGITCAEITLRTPAGEPALAKMASDPRLLVGAGTVLDAEAARRCIAAGARFVVSPGYDDEIVRVCRSLDAVAIPGVATATEVQRARRNGLRAVKFFPALQLGGLGTLKALSGPFADMAFLPTGGVSAGSAREYLAHPAVLAVGGSWMVARPLIRARRWEEVERLCREATDIVRSARASGRPGAAPGGPGQAVAS